MKKTADPSRGVRKKFGKRMRFIRTERALSQEQLGFKCGLDRTYISGIERGLRNPSLKNIFKIAEALDVRMDMLFTEKLPPLS